MQSELPTKKSELPLFSRLELHLWHKTKTNLLLLVNLAYNVKKSNNPKICNLLTLPIPCKIYIILPKFGTKHLRQFKQTIKKM